MSIRITFPGGKRVDAAFDTRVVKTDQSQEHGGDGTAPEPFELFLASLATCAGLYVLGFCQARNIPTQDIQLTQHHHFDATSGRLERIELDILVPPAFPEKYRVAIERAAASCKVKKALMSPPEIVVTARSAQAA